MKRITLFMLCLATSSTTLSQNEGALKCGSDNYYQQHLDNHPEVFAEREQLEEFTANYIQSYNPEEKKTGITIPVVFHVNDPTNPQKVTMAQIESALEILNEDFTATNSDISSIRPEFVNVIANMDITFCLASKDPTGNPTTGVTYHTNNYNGREPSGYGAAVKSVEYWPGEKYLNIWIVNETEDDGSLYNSGWAYLPDSWVANNNLDGIVYNHRYLGYTGSSEVSGPSSWQAEMARVLTHEVGHYLNLHHTFYNYCASPGDYVDDTPYVYYHGSNNCDQLGTLCATTTVVMDQNFMDYTPCPSMYSIGQKSRVMAALNSTVAGRNNLWTNANLIAVGCASSADLIEISDGTGFHLFPNPANDLLNLELSTAPNEDFSIRVLNTIGQELKTTLKASAYALGIITMDIADLPDGVYLIELESSQGITTRRFIKSN